MTIERFLVYCYTEFADRATVVNFLPLLAERFARQRLRALARVEGLAADGKPVVLFVCTHNTGRSPMALAFFQHHAGDAALAWSGGRAHTREASRGREGDVPPRQRTRGGPPEPPTASVHLGWWGPKREAGDMADQVGAGEAGGQQHDHVQPDDSLALIAERLHSLEHRLTPFLTRAGRSAAGELGLAVPAWRRRSEGEKRWPVSLAVLSVITFQVLLPDQLTLISPWVLPVIEAVILATVAAMNPHRIDRHSPVVRALGLLLVTVASLANAWSMAQLVHGLLTGTAGQSAAPLLSSAANIWLTNVIIFALWYWELDRGGPVARAHAEDLEIDFLFPQMATPETAPLDWEPRFADYLYVSFTNATAFSPTDTMPLTRWAKMAMALQAAISLVTAVLVIARAVNILK